VLCVAIEDRRADGDDTQKKKDKKRKGSSGECMARTCNRVCNACVCDCLLVAKERGEKKSPNIRVVFPSVVEAWAFHKREVKRRPDYYKQQSD